jgi:DNA mismatch repair protein MutS
MSTPLMKQYHRIKSENRGASLLFRMGDFYEMFDEDAVVASKVLGLALTSRNHGEDAKTPLCGFPYHALDRYMFRLINAGHKVAVCEQVQDPREAKGIVDRDIVEVVTKGTATNPELLKEKTNNFLVAVHEGRDSFGLAGADVSTGEFFTGEVKPASLQRELERLSPVEILFASDDGQKALPAYLKSLPSQAVMTPLEPWRFALDSAYKALTGHFKTTTLEGFGIEGLKSGIVAAGALFGYIREQKKDRVGHIRKVAPFQTDRFMALDGATLRNLEILSPIHAEDEKGTLLYVLDRTKTAMGGRLLKRLLVNPLIDAAEVEKRQDGTTFFHEQPQVREKFRTLLSTVADVERLIGRIGFERANPRDLLSLKHSLLAVQKIIPLFSTGLPDILNSGVKGLSGTEPVTRKLETAVSDDAPLALSDGGVFKKGYSKELDAITDGAAAGKEWIACLQPKERERTGINSLKVSFNRVFGYYIEISKTHLDKVPEGYIRKQTLVNGERFITEDLKKYEELVLSAEEKQKALEVTLFGELRKGLLVHLGKLQEVSDCLAIMDCLADFAEVASANGYVRPEVNKTDEIVIEDGRHPVIESLDFSETFVPNNTEIRSSGQFIHLITGPNMAGKSTYLRQVGLIVLLAQVGAYVPARSAKIGLTDRIFTRVGASDRLAKGLSTFLVEMQELANILNNAGPKSLVLLDEIGRGTSTFDGLSIAWALVEYIHEKVRAKTLFATHYHELTDIPLVLKGVKNYNVSVKEWNDEIIFLRKIIEGACDHSYGIQVARLAGVPQEVVKRAKEVLKNLEQNELTPDQKPVIARHEEEAKAAKAKATRSVSQLSIFDTTGADIIEMLRKLDVNSLTPVEALNKLAEMKKRLMM